LGGTLRPRPDSLPAAAACRAFRIFADNDASGTGQAAAHTLAARLVKAAIAAEVVLPPLSDTDWLDVLNGKEDA
jgi:hypothetical protein